MTIRSERYRGLIYAGITPMASTLRIEQTGPMQITVRAGSFTGTSGERIDLANDAVLDIAHSGAMRVDLYATPDGACVLARGLDDAVPVGWRLVHPLVYGFAVPAGTRDLAAIDMAVLAVRPGFPPGTTAEDWTQHVGVA